MSEISLILIVWCVGYTLFQTTLTLALLRLLRRPALPCVGQLPNTVVVVPCHDASPGFADRVRVLLEQDHPNYRVVLVTESHQDPAWEVISQVVAGHRTARLVTAGPAWGRSQKVHNLLRGLREAGDAEVLAFADSDVVHHPDWLSRLTAPLTEPNTASATGCLWLEAPGAGIWGRAMAWTINQASLPFFACPWIPIVWGGSMAIRSEAFHALALDQVWRDAAYDDLSMTAALWRRRWRAVFVPDLVLSSPVRDERFSACLTWYSRQMIATKFYMPLFHALNLSRIPWLAAQLAGPWLLLLGILVPGLDAVGSVGLALVSLLVIRMASGMALCLGSKRPEVARDAGLQYVSAFLDLVVALRSVAGRRIHWAGRDYQLFSGRTRVLKASDSRSSPRSRQQPILDYRRGKRSRS